MTSATCATAQNGPFLVIAGDLLVHKFEGAELETFSKEVIIHESFNEYATAIITINCYRIN